MKRKTAAVLAALLLFSAFAGPLPVRAQTLSIRRVVSVVYDDSGSMNQGGKKDWAYANYAMQALASLLDKDDQLYITFMTRPSISEKFDLDGNIQQTVDKIRSRTESGGTPFSSINTAYNKLSSISDPDPNTQYWLIVITDGEFGDASDNLVPKSVLDSRMNEIISSDMPNGSKPQVIYFAIGRGAIRPDSNEQKGLFVYPRSSSGNITDIADGDKIIEVMSEIADKISGRTRIQPSKIVFTDDKTAEVTTDLPVLNIAILSQKTNVTVTEASSSSVKLTLDQSAVLMYPESSKFVTDKSLVGNTFLFSRGDITIPEGKYVFKFSEPVNKDSIVFMYEPALEVRMKVYLPNGNEVTDLNELREDDKISVVCTIYETGTDRIINPDTLGQDITYSLTYSVGGITAAETKDKSLSLTGLTLIPADSELKSSVVIPGYQPLTNVIQFHPQKLPDMTMQAQEPADPGIKRTELYKNEKGIIFTVYSDGVPVTKEKLKNTDYSFRIEDPFGRSLDLEVTLNDDGTFLCVPVYDVWSIPGKWFWKWSSSWVIPTGELTVTGSIGDNELASGTLNVVRESLLESLINYLLPFIFLFFVLGWIFKRRFRRKTRVKVIDAQNRGTSFMSAGANWSTKKLRQFTVWSLVPWAASRRKAAGLTFYARPGGLIGVRVSKVGEESRKLNGRNVKEDRAVNIPASTLPRSFVPKSKEERAQMKFQDFDIGEVLMEASNMQSCKLIKFVGGN